MLHFTRRKFFTGLMGFFGGLLVSKTAAARLLTPKASEGPFYPIRSMRKPDIDNDLVKIQGHVEQAGGEVFNLKGRIKDQSGRPLKGLRIEIWQCDLNGNYMHPRDRRSANFDGAFQGFGHDVTNENGEYIFRTIKPASYPGRTPHIHVKVLKGTQEVLTTQFYVKNHPDNEGDFLFRFMSNEQAETVSMNYISRNNKIEAQVDITL